MTGQEEVQDAPAWRGEDIKVGDKICFPNPKIQDWEERRCTESAIKKNGHGPFVIDKIMFYPRGNGPSLWMIHFTNDNSESSELCSDYFVACE